ncbi:MULTISPECIES: GFA family protein [Halomonadaceae]|uniref:GFA family protein n=1 Tax=Modicisalibacter zincidurans TaxID=1178777 RepID=A0ABP9RES7_9GAMM|nr:MULTISPECIES: GFA family protein [Halomonas]MCD6009485.1 GFA family protein [Halomonas sp. IOP_31]MEA3251663.1 GFA family protein [Pseudomonadota bacterium]
MSANHQCQGACLCGAVNLSVELDSHEVSACHCQMCQTWGGGPLLAIESRTPMTLRGKESVSVYASSEWAERGFCRHCGTHLFYRLKEGGHYAFPVGLIDNGDPWAMALQIFIDEKPAHYDFANDTRTLTGAEVFEAFSKPADG